jgi:hypothetical protein
MKYIRNLSELVTTYNDPSADKKEHQVTFGRYKSVTLDKVPTRYVSWAKREVASPSIPSKKMEPGDWKGSEKRVEIPKLDGRFVHNVYLKALSELSGFDVSIPYKDLTEEQKLLRVAIAEQSEKILRDFVDKLMSTVTSTESIRTSAESILKEMFGE